ncbi:hypothetical protein HDU93_004870 [Gonapodya sp. JEL0774]|nr:hypothetical protein HDU93_004870 [Gonapodya sp. JEL0774]
MAYHIRPINFATDLNAIHTIYSFEVRTGTATWECDEPSVEEMKDRVKKVLDGGFPWYVATFGDGEAEIVVGYSYASSYRPRFGYRYTVENSVYVHRDHQRKGLGSLLLQRLIPTCGKLGYRQMVAVIGTADSGSKELHAKNGFQQVGHLKRIGFKFGKWIDIVLMQIELGEGSGSPGAALNAWNGKD